MSGEENASAIKAYALLTGTAICFGANTTFAKLALGEVSPLLLVALRWLLVVLFVVTLNRRTLVDDWPRLKPHLGFLFLMGALGFAAFNGLFYIAANYTSAINMGIIAATMPVFVLLGALVLYQDRVRPLQWIGAVITLIGVALVAVQGSFERLLELRFNLGDGLVLFATVLYGGYTLGLRRRPPSTAISLFTVLAASAFLASLPMVAAEAWLGNFQAPSARGWVVVVLVALFPSFLAQVMFIRGVEIIGPDRAGIFLNLVPVFAAVIAVAYLGETFRLFHGIALLAVIGGIWLAERHTRQRVKPGQARS